MTIFHPAPDHRGGQVVLANPSSATDLASWQRHGAVATAVPLSASPEPLGGVAFAPWVPAEDHIWQLLGDVNIDEPPFYFSDVKAAAAGIAMIEPDGRVWLVSPSNQFGGYLHSLPKGRVDPGMSLHATAIREAYEETGLLAEITGFLLDSSRTRTQTRFYVGRRIGGCPSQMGWESQAVHLVPRVKLPEFLVHANDQPVLQALLELTS